MTLLDYIKPLDKDALAALAKRCETTPGQLKQVAYGNRRANASLAISLERETGGVIRCEVTRPDIDWAYLRNTAATPDAGKSKRILPRRGDRRGADRRQGERRQEDRRA